MHQIKFFKGVENELGELERDMNAWLKNNGVRVLNIFGNMSPQSAKAEATPASLLGQTRPSGRAFDASDIFIAVLYEQA